MAISLGNDQRLRTGPRCCFAGDWLTHFRMEICKWLRMLAPHPNENFTHLGPIVGEHWHNKQDLLEVLVTNDTGGKHPLPIPYESLSTQVLKAHLTHAQKGPPNPHCGLPRVG